MALFVVDMAFTSWKASCYRALYAGCPGRIYQLVQTVGPERCSLCHCPTTSSSRRKRLRRAPESISNHDSTLSNMGSIPSRPKSKRKVINRSPSEKQHRHGEEQARWGARKKRYRRRDRRTEANEVRRQLWEDHRRQLRSGREY